MTAKFCTTLDSALIAIEAIDLKVGDIILQGQTYAVVEEINNHHAVPIRYFNRSISSTVFYQNFGPCQVCLVRRTEPRN